MHSLQNWYTYEHSLRFSQGNTNNLFIVLIRTVDKNNVLTYYCCYNKLLQVRWLKTIQIYYRTVLEIRSLKWSGRPVLNLDSLGESPCLCFPASYAAHVPYLMAPFRSNLCFHRQIFSLTLLHPPCIDKDPCDHTEYS